MSSEDVIELGSSDEETKPAPKKRKLPRAANIQVCKKGPALSIPPMKNDSKFNPMCIDNGKIGKSVTVTKIPKQAVNNLYANKNIVKGIPIKLPPLQSSQIQIRKNISLPFVNKANKVSHGTAIHIPIQAQKNLISQGKTGLNPLSITNVKKPIVPIRIAGTISQINAKTNAVNKSLSTLPPGITVTRTSSVVHKPAMKAQKTVHIIPIIRPIKMNDDVVNIDLDDDVPTTSTAPGPQWYLRPEDEVQGESIEKSSDVPMESIVDSNNSLDKLQDKTCENSTETSSQLSPSMSVKSTSNIDKNVNEHKEISPISKSPEKTTGKTPEQPECSTIEQQNNEEPDKSKYIEITIEDSPLKPKPNQIGFKVGEELAITIDDSPIKITMNKINKDSDDENEIVSKNPNSKKKLEYPQVTEMSKTIEIEIEPFSGTESNIETNNYQNGTQWTDIVEIKESPCKPEEPEQVCTPKKNKPENPKVKNIQIESTDKGNDFHPTYQSFIDLCLEMENSDEMKKIVDIKIKAYYRQVPKIYTESEEFIDMVASKITAIKAGPDKMYLYIKDIVDELNLQRKIAKSQPKIEDQIKLQYGEESEFDSKRLRQIQKLEKTMKKLHRTILKLEEQEVDFDDDDDSVYLLTERYKERMVKVHAKLCQLSNTKMPSEPRVHIEARLGQPKGPANRLEKWINKKVPIGKPLPFPDFHDVLKCVREANKEDKLNWNEVEIMEEARDLFMRCGKKLQRRRQENEWRLAASRLQKQVDPAENSEELKKKLDNNKIVAAKKEIDVFNKYADRQNQLNLEPVEISDNEADASPADTDDEEVIEDNKSLPAKDVGDERLKQSDESKSSERKENQDHNGEKQNDTENSQSIESDAKKLTSKSPVKESSNASKSKDGEERDDEKAHSLSDDSNIDSDIDELHLLQEFRSKNENCNKNSSDSEPLAISDSSIADLSDSDKEMACDIISIENSSESESEDRREENETERLSDKEIRDVSDSNAICDRNVARENNDGQKIKFLEELHIVPSGAGGNKLPAVSLSEDRETHINLSGSNIVTEKPVTEGTSNQNSDLVDEANTLPSDENSNVHSSDVEGMDVDTTDINCNDEQNNISEDILLASPTDASTNMYKVNEESKDITSRDDTLIEKALISDNSESANSNSAESTVGQKNGSEENIETNSAKSIDINVNTIDKSTNLKPVVNGEDII